MMLMSIFLSLLGVLLLLALAVTAYSAVLASLYPENLRTGEVTRITTADLWKLRVCRYRKPDCTGEPILFVHGLNANQNNFTNPAGGCLVDFFAARGYDCWTVDLRGTRSSQAPFGKTTRDITVDDYVYHDVPAAIEHVCRETGRESLHYVGHSLGGFLLYAYSLTAGGRRIASGTTLGSPVSFVKALKLVPPPLRWLAVNLPWVGGEFIRLAVPIARAMGASIDVFPINQANLPFNMTNQDLYTMLDDPSSGVHEQIFGWAERGEIAFKKGAFNFTEKLPELDVPVLAIFGKSDPFIDAEEGAALFDQLQSPDKKLLVLSRATGCVEDYNHCDLAFSREAEKEVFTPIAEWMAAHPCAMAPAEDAPAAEDAPVKKAAPKKRAAAPRKAAVKTETEKAPAASKKSAAAKKPAARKAAAKKAEPAVEEAPVKPAPAKRKAAPRKKTAAAPPAEAPETDTGENA